MSDAQDYLLVIDNDKAEALRIATKTSEKLETRQTNLITVVQSLGEYINDDDAKIRGSAVSYLTAVLSALNPKFLSRQQIQVLCQFYCDRIEDGPGALDGLIKLQGLDRFNNEMVQLIARAILQHFQDMQTRPQSSRYHILTLVNELMSNHRKALLNMGDEFLVGFTDLVSGEKDPRNLMLVFSMVRVLMLEWDIINHAETLFEAVYAYFPITFRPPPNDPYGITAQDLKERLKDCISSTHLLAPYAMPQLLDKLDSTSANVKRDVLQALKACAATYEPRIMSQYSIPIWDALKFEVLSAQEHDIAEETLQTLKAIASNLSRDVTKAGPTSLLAQYLRPINKECNEHIQEPAQRQAKASGDILQSLSSTNDVAHTIVIKAVVPPLLTVYQDAGGIMKQRALLDIMNQLLDSCIDVFGTWKGLSKPSLENPLLQFKDQMLELYSQALMSTMKEEVSFRISATKGLLRMCKIKDILQDNEVGLVVQHLNDIVLREGTYGRNELKKIAMESLAEISRYKPRPIMDITFPAFMADLPDSDDVAEATRDYFNTLEGLAEISVEKEPFEVLIRRLLSKFDILLQTHNYDKPAYSRAILSTILFTMDRRELKGDSNLIGYYERIVKGLIQKSVQAEPSQRTALNDESVLDVLGRLSNLIARNLPQDKQMEVAERVRILQGKDQTGGIATIVTDPNYIAKMVLSTWLLASLPRNIEAVGFKVDEVADTLQELVSVASIAGPDKQTVLLATLRQIALYINKHLPAGSLTVADTLLASVYSSVATFQNGDSTAPTGDDDFITNRIYLIFVITKALLLRLAPSTTSHVQRLLTLLSPTLYPQTTSSQAASAFRTLMLPDPVLSTTNHFVVRKLAPQRLFMTLVPSIATSFRSTSSPSEKENYLTALAGILGTVPKDVVMPELPTLLPLLLQSLDVADATVKLATLQTLLVVVTENCAALVESGHVDTLVKRLLKIANSISRNTKNSRKEIAPEDMVVDVPACRQAASHLLGKLPRAVSQALSEKSTANPLLPLKQEVLRELLKVLDDPRRDVRKEAVDARAAWFRGVDEIDDDSD